MQNKIINMARELLEIERDIVYRFDYTNEKPEIDDFDINIFEQTWGDTSLGFGGIGGQAMTTANTYVFVPVWCKQKCFVYFGSRFAYAAPWCAALMSDLSTHSMKSVARSGAYRSDVPETED